MLLEKKGIFLYFFFEFLSIALLIIMIKYWLILTFVAIIMGKHAVHSKVNLQGTFFLYVSLKKL